MSPFFTQWKSPQNTHQKLPGRDYKSTKKTTSCLNFDLTNSMKCPALIKRDFRRRKIDGLDQAAMSSGDSPTSFSNNNDPSHEMKETNNNLRNGSGKYTESQKSVRFLNDLNSEKIVS